MAILALRYTARYDGREMGCLRRGRSERALRLPRCDLENGEGSQAALWCILTLPEQQKIKSGIRKGYQKRRREIYALILSG